MIKYFFILLYFIIIYLKKKRYNIPHFKSAMLEIFYKFTKTHSIRKIIQLFFFNHRLVQTRRKKRLCSTEVMTCFR